MSSHCVVVSTKIRSISKQTQLNSICNIELHIASYLRSSSVSQFVVNA